MTDENKLHRDVNRQAQAEALMRNELLTEAFAELDKTYVEAWRGAADPIAREQLWLAQGSLRKLRAHLGMVVSNGKLAQAEIDQLTAARKRAASQR